MGALEQFEILLKIQRSSRKFGEFTFYNVNKKWALVTSQLFHGPGYWGVKPQNCDLMLGLDSWRGGL